MGHFQWCMACTPFICLVQWCSCLLLDDSEVPKLLGIFPQHRRITVSSFGHIFRTYVFLAWMPPSMNLQQKAIQYPKAVCCNGCIIMVGMEWIHLEIQRSYEDAAPAIGPLLGDQISLWFGFVGTNFRRTHISNLFQLQTSPLESNFYHWTIVNIYKHFVAQHLVFGGVSAKCSIPWHWKKDPPCSSKRWRLTTPWTLRRCTAFAVSGGSWPADSSTGARALKLGWWEVVKPVS